jgi:ribonuclease Z
MNPLKSPNGIKIISAWTQAGMGSCVHVKGFSKHEDIIFDIGLCNPSHMSANSVFISHGHIDHIGAAIIHGRMKTLTQSIATYYVPECAFQPLLNAKLAYEQLDQSEIKMNIVKVSPGEIIRVSLQLSVRVFETVHRVPSQGYAIYVTVLGGLAPQYKHLSSNELGRLKKSGANIYLPNYESLEFVYTGDTIMEGLLTKQNKFIFQSPILFIEVTYIDGDVSKAHDWGHIHLDEIIKNADRFQNQILVLCHLSSKYSLSYIIQCLKRKMPMNLAKRVHISLKSFGATEELTPLLNIPVHEMNRQVGNGWVTHNNNKMKSRFIQNTSNHYESDNSLLSNDNTNLSHSEETLVDFKQKVSKNSMVSHSSPESISISNLNITDIQIGSENNDNNEMEEYADGDEDILLDEERNTPIDKKFKTRLKDNRRKNYDKNNDDMHEDDS